MLCSKRLSLENIVKPKMRTLLRTIFLLVFMQSLPAFSDDKALPTAPVNPECYRVISAKIGNADLQSMCLDDIYPSRPMIVISRLHRGGVGVETLARFPFETECNWTPDMAQLVCDSTGWSPLAGATFENTSTKGCASHYTCKSGCDGRHTPREIVLTDLACQYPPGTTSNGSTTSSCVKSERHKDLTVCKLDPVKP